MPKLLTQLWESWLSVFWEMSGIQETEVPAHTIQQVGGEKREQGVRGNRSPGLRGLSVRGFMYREELRVQEGDSW